MVVVVVIVVVVPDNPCRSSPCRNNGTCQLSDETVSCECPKKFVGGFCEVFVSGE